MCIETRDVWWVPGLGRGTATWILSFSLSPLPPLNLASLSGEKPSLKHSLTPLSRKYSAMKVLLFCLMRMFCFINSSRQVPCENQCSQSWDPPILPACSQPKRCSRNTVKIGKAVTSWQLEIKGKYFASIQFNNSAFEFFRVLTFFLQLKWRRRWPQSQLEVSIIKLIDFKRLRYTWLSVLDHGPGGHTPPWRHLSLLLARSKEEWKRMVGLSQDVL